MMAMRITSAQLLKQFESNPYCTGAYILTNDGRVFTTDEVLEDFDTFIEEHKDLFYAIHWEGEPIETESGEFILPIYN